ncbi:patatin family protein [Shewanella sp. SM34]|uniref:patatin-like phospholipase family protein n=1 Tax=unclassified Shewanella TaxID=196818 RepID=UPI0021DB0B51|nr:MULTISPECIES: patatin family protein [unclassified Shewanella]MCU8008534.1 patatin family protein [Shewanella sp. SM87]MCU8058351.1 patatin family protein [Shewanella sp. SM35]MCU8067303.1 patatin family protein [Shewanella sp. SM34]MCU8074818.1 patatin family protein [Shewanella sp. SM29]
MHAVSHLTSKDAQSNASPQVALIAEGGGQRGIFTAGVLDAWLDGGFDPFDLFIGTSAGSQNLSSFLARQKGYAKRLIRGLSRHKRFYRLGRGLVGGNVVDLDWYFEQTRQGMFKLDLNAATASLGHRQLLITTTNASDRKGYFLSPSSKGQWRELLKASSALPFLYKQGVKLTPWLSDNACNSDKASNNGAANHSASDNSASDHGAALSEGIDSDFYLDGGLAAPLPVREAYRRGARKIVVIRTVSEDFQAQSAWVHKLKSWICVSGFCPKTIDYLVQHEQAYQDELDFIANPPEDVEIVQIFAAENLQSKLLGSTDADLRHDYHAGLSAGKQFLTQDPMALTQSNAYFQTQVQTNDKTQIHTNAHTQAQIQPFSALSA